ncbi:hypothetical protein ACH4TV_11510 [Streptomyces sp. NPDC020898]|uniref:hypothetical protein n=1 Tax=Streptomyces sp. NPDC020898 TaxID=3365101 RepID=UPI0037B9F154
MARPETAVRIPVLGGRRDCRALTTLGTPHRGSVRAPDTLADGFPYLPGVRDLTRGFPSVHERRSWRRHGPRVSAMPPATPEDRCGFVPQAHSALQSPRVLTSRLLPLLVRLQLPGDQDVRGPTDPLARVAPAISSEVDDAYPGSAPATLRARVVGAARTPDRLLASVTREVAETLSLVLRQVAPARYEAREVLAPGLYDIEITAGSGSPAPDPVQDCFAVLPDGP